MEGRKTLSEKLERSARTEAVSSVALNAAAEKKVWIAEETNLSLFYPSNDAIF